MGTSTAFHLAEAGVDVLLLERGRLGGGSTSKAAGGVRAQFSDALNIALGARGLEAFADFPRRPGQEIDLHRSGYLFLLTRADDVAAFEAARRAAERARRPDPAAVAARGAALVPGVTTDDVLAATFHAGDGCCAPGVRRPRLRVAARGGTAPACCTGVEVLGFEPDGDGTTAVRTTAGDVRAGAVVCAAGAWSRALGAMAGVELPVTPLRRQILVTEPLPDGVEAALPASMPMTIDAAHDLLPAPGGARRAARHVVGGEGPASTTDVDDGWLPDLTAADRAAGAGAARRRHRRALGRALRDHAGPQRPARRGGGTGVRRRFLYATGFSGHGFLQGPAVGEILRDLYLRPDAVRRRVPALGRPLRPRRPAPGTRDRLTAPAPWQCEVSRRCGRGSRRRGPSSCAGAGTRTGRRPRPPRTTAG